MALPLVDVSKFKVSEEVHAYFSAEAHVSGRHINELIRDALEGFVATRLHVAKVADLKLKAKGLPGILGDSGR